MRFLASILAISLAFPILSRADWQVRSEFLLHLPETAFDSLIQDFWSSLNGTQNVAVGNFSANFDDTQITINGVNVAVNYSFPVPQRLNSGNTREWQLESNSIAATVTVDQLLITQHKTIYIGGIPVGSTVNVECDKVALSLPAGNASVVALIQAGIVNNQVQLSMPSFQATWPSNAWQLTQMNCPNIANVGQTVETEILAYLSNFQNLNTYISSSLQDQFKSWSQKASILLLSQQNLPTGLNYLTASFEPATATDMNPNGLVLGGTVNFDYPYVANGQHIEQDFTLPTDTKITPQANPQLLAPFAAIKAMFVGQYFAGQLSYSMQSKNIPGFSSFMGNFFEKLFAWPDLLRFPSDTNFVFQAVPIGPPSFLDDASGGENVITGNLTQPLALHMYAPMDGIYVPYVELATIVTGPTKLTLSSTGQVQFEIAASQEPVSYAFADSFVSQYYPNTYIATGAIASSAYTTLSTQGLQLTLPSVPVGASLKLSPSEWNLMSGDVLQLEFSTNSPAAASQ
jgi:hypothetical protein